MSTANLTGDDVMAHGFLQRAADAIIDRSSLRVELAGVRQALDDISLARDTLDEIKRTQEDEIERLRTHVANLQGREKQLMEDLNAAHLTIDARQRDIDILDESVDSLNQFLHEAEQSRDYWKARSELQAEALNDVCDKLNAVHTALGKPPLDPDPRVEIDSATSTPVAPTDFREAPVSTEDREREPEYHYETDY